MPPFFCNSRRLPLFCLSHFAQPTRRGVCVCVRVCLSVCVCNCCILYIAKSVARLCVLFFCQVETSSRVRNRGSQLRQRQRQMPAGIHFGLFRSVSRSQTIDRERDMERERENVRACLLSQLCSLSLFALCSLELFLGTVQHAVSKPKLKSLW